MSISSNIPEFNAMLSKVIQKSKGSEANKIIAAAATRLQQQLILNSPVKSGRLRDSWFVKKMGNMKYIVYNNTGYAIYVEFGTYRSRKHVGFARNTVKQTTETLKVELFKGVRWWFESSW